MIPASSSSWNADDRLNKPASRSWKVQSNLDVIGPIVEEIVILSRSAGFSPRQCRFNIPIAVTEAVANAILRGNGSDPSLMVEVSVAVSHGRLVVEVFDEGNGFDLMQLEQSPDDDDWYERENGRGIFLMRNLVDEIVSVPSASNGRHCLRLTMNCA